MDENQFWEIIDKLFKNEAIDLDTKKDIFLFDKIFKEKLIEAYTFPLMAVSFVISSYISDEGFKEFRAWLIFQGKENFYSAINNPDSIAEWLEKDAIEEINELGDDLLLITLNLYLNLGFSEDDFFNNSYNIKEPVIEMNWPENRKEYRALYPKIVDKFWNQESINNLH